MRVVRCDICRKVIKDGDQAARAIVGTTPLLGHDFCAKCGKPVLDFLTKHGFANKP